MRSPLATARRQALRLAYGFLYGPGAITYEGIAALVSVGEWAAWRRAAVGHVRGQDVLELGLGTGRLIPELAGDHCYTGLDPSPWMQRVARRYHYRHHGGYGSARPARAPHLVRGRAEALPFGGCVFDSVIATFPTSYIFDPRTHAEIRRVLRPEGRLIVVAEAYLRPSGRLAKLANLALELTGDRLTPALADALRTSGFAVTELSEHHPRSTSSILIARQPR